jgi:quercetin dioxygenase-like cupin family protein
MGSPTYTCIADLAREVEIPRNGILTRTLHQDDRLKVVVFGFDAGQELSEHTASTPAVLHFLQGEADLTLGADSMREPGSTCPLNSLTVCGRRRPC